MATKFWQSGEYTANSTSANNAKINIPESVIEAQAPNNGRVTGMKVKLYVKHHGTSGSTGQYWLYLSGNTSNVLSTENAAVGTSYYEVNNINIPCDSNGCINGNIVVEGHIIAFLSIKWTAKIDVTWTYEDHTHSYTSSVTTQPTCSTAGVRTYICSCGHSYTESIPATGNHNSNTTIPAVAATCTATGLTEGKKCSVCGTVTVAQTTVAAKGHTAVTDAAVAATCTTAGKTAGSHCSVCGTVITAQQTVAALGHNMGDYVQIKAPTYSETGEKRSNCSRCDHYDIQTIAALGFPVFINTERVSGVYYVESEKTIYFVISGSIPAGESNAFNTVDGIHFKVTNSVPSSGKVITGIYHNTTLMK